MMVGEEKVYPDILQYEARYAQWIMFPAVISFYGDAPVDQYGAMLKVNEDAVIKKCCFLLYLNDNGYLTYRKLGVKAENVTSARYVPFLAYRGRVVYDGESSPDISVYDLTWNSDGYYMSDKIDANLETKDGERLSNYSIEFDQENVRLVYTESEFNAYLSL